MPMLITDPRQPDNPIVFANAAFTKLTGYDRHEIVGRNCRFLQGPDTDRDEVARLRAAIEERTAIELELLNYRKDGTTFWNRLLVSPVFDDDGALTYFFASQFDVTLERERLTRLERDRSDLKDEVARRDAVLHASEQRLRLALEAGRLGSWSLDLQSGRMIVTEGCKRNFGRPLADPFTYEELKAAVHPDDRAMRDAALATAIEGGGPYEAEYRIFTPAGEERWLHVRGQASYGADGTPLSMVGVSQDVTERRRADDHRALLANELSHRVKNGMALTQAVIAQTLRRATSLEEAASIIDARIQAMASANDLLVDERWESASIRDVLDRALGPFGVRDAALFQLAGPDVRLPPRTAVALALALHEVATNAAKYGALSQAGGHVRVAWEVVDGRRLHLGWSEHGGPPVAIPTRTGFGTRLIERLMAQDAGGGATIEYRPGGVVLTLVTTLADNYASH